MLSRLVGGVGDTSADALSPEEFEDSIMESPLTFGTFKIMESPLTFGTFKMVAGAVCHRWYAGLLVDGIGSLHGSAGGPAWHASWNMQYSRIVSLSPALQFFLLLLGGRVLASQV